MNKSITLIELLVGLVLFTIIVLGFINIDLFSRYQALSADRRSKLQNEVSLALEHMAKHISQAVGSEFQIPIATSTSPNRLTIWIDSNPNGYRDAADTQIAYEYNSANYAIRFYPDSTLANYDVVAQRIMPDFSMNPATGTPTHLTYLPANNYIYVQVSSCWDPDGSPNACGTQDNPQITMQTRISMPSVSTN